MLNGEPSATVQTESEKNWIPDAGADEVNVTAVGKAWVVSRSSESFRSRVNAWQKPASTVGPASGLNTSFFGLAALMVWVWIPSDNGGTVADAVRVMPIALSALK